MGMQYKSESVKLDREPQNVLDTPLKIPMSTNRPDLQPSTRFDGVEEFGPRVKIPLGELVSKIRAIDSSDLETQIHLLRHFRSVSNEYLQSIIGKTYETTDFRTGAVTPNLIDQRRVDQALGTVGSKFDPNLNGMSNPKELIEFVKSVAIARAEAGELVFIDKGFCKKTLFTSNFTHRIGTDSIVTLAPEQTPWTGAKEPRGKLAGDDLLVNILPGHPGVPTSKVGVVLAILEDTGKAAIFTACPGELAQGLPNDRQSPEEMASNAAFWSSRAFVR
jgi:hypothetical protein